MNFIKNLKIDIFYILAGKKYKSPKFIFINSSVVHLPSKNYLKKLDPNSIFFFNKDKKQPWIELKNSTYTA